MNTATISHGKQSDIQPISVTNNVFSASENIKDSLVGTLDNTSQSVVSISHEALNCMSLDDREHLSETQKFPYIQKFTVLNTPRAKSFIEKCIKTSLVKFSLPLEEQTKYFAHNNLMTDNRSYDITCEYLEGLAAIIDDLPQGAKIAELGSGQGQTLAGIGLMYKDKNFSLIGLDFATKPSVSLGAFYLADLNKGIPGEFPTKIDVLYSNKTLQYVRNITGVLRDSYAHLADGGCMLLHLGYLHSFTKGVLAAFKQLQNMGYIEAFGWKQDTPGMPPSVYIAVQKKQSMPTIPFPVIESTYPDTSLLLYNSDVAASCSHLYCEYKLPQESSFQYELDAEVQRAKVSQERA